MTDTSWSKLIDTEMGEYVFTLMSDPVLKYHTPDHIRRLYAQAKEWNLPYDVNLDAGILWHDAIYDNQPEKEYRSAEAMLEASNAMPHWFEDMDVMEVYRKIMSTAGHDITDGQDSSLVKLDLAELGDEERFVENFWTILEESRNLYDIDTPTAAKGTLDFMRRFNIIITENYVYDLGSDMFLDDGGPYWYNVQKGVIGTQAMAQTVVELYDRGLN